MKAVRNSGGLPGLIAETETLVAKLVSENRALRAENLRLQRELEKLSKDWEEVRRLARGVPRQRARG